MVGLSGCQHRGVDGEGCGSLGGCLITGRLFGAEKSVNVSAHATGGINSHGNKGIPVGELGAVHVAQGSVAINGVSGAGGTVAVKALEEPGSVGHYNMAACKSGSSKVFDAHRIE